MKKKMSISVVDIIHRITHPPSHSPPPPKKPGTLLHAPKPLRFEELYKRAISGHPRPSSTHHTSERPSLSRHPTAKTTPLNTRRITRVSQTCSLNCNKKSQGSSWVSSLANSGKKTVISSVPSHRLIEPFKENVDENGGADCTPAKGGSERRRKDREREPGAHECIQDDSFSARLQVCLKNLNHESHCHLRQRNQCFLSEDEIDEVLEQLGYNLQCGQHKEFLKLLEVDIYGGAPSENLKEVLAVIEGKGERFATTCFTLKHMPKIIDNNLKVVASEESKNTIAYHFRNFKNNKLTDKENQPALPSKLPLACSSSNKPPGNPHQETESTEKHFTSSSPPNPTTTTNTAITELPELHCPQQPVSPKLAAREEPLLSKPAEDTPGTFRQIERMGDLSTGEGSEFNFSRQLSWEGRPKDTTDIADLKDRLNQALKPPPPSPYCPDEPRELPGYLCGNYKYGTRPILSIDVNLGEGLSEKIIVFEGETAHEVAERLGAKYTISEETKLMFEKILESHLSTMLWKIDEVSEEMLTDRTENEG